MAGAVKELERALELQPYNADALVLLADLYARQGAWDRTRALVEEALRFDPQHRGARQRLNALQQGR
jgi:tetratricopeptide (TPR) repeat protein